MTSYWLKGLNPEQAEVVSHDAGPLAVFAGAGSGKTKALVHRIGRLIQAGTPPDRILAVTFSTKAADEMLVRLKGLGITSARVGTWHSLAWQILREDRTPYASWNVDDSDRHRILVKQAMGYKHINWVDGDVSKVVQFIGVAKANLWYPTSQGARDMARLRFQAFAPLALDAFKISEALVQEERLLTFDDMLLRVFEHLSVEQNRALWAARWSYVLQDEVQDANEAQVEIAWLLAHGHRNYMIVGDPAQSIFSFRGSSPHYLSDFVDRWGAKLITMHRNYRSCTSIVDIANNAIRPAEMRLPVDLEAVRQEPGKVNLVAADGLDDEAERFASRVAEGAAEGTPYSSFTGLYRTNAQSRALEEAFMARKIPYAIVGGTVFYGRKEVKDLLAYLRVAAGTDLDGDAVRRCINAPFRFLGTRFVERVMELAGDDVTVRWTDIVREAASFSGIQRRQVDSAWNWAYMIEKITESLDTVGPTQILNDIVTGTKYIEWLEKEEGEETIESSHAANVKELIRVAGRFKTVTEFLTFVDEQTEKGRQEGYGKKDRVLLMSVHRAKGLEWPHVWVVGCNEKVLPHAKGNIDEERRIFYVAVTRARDELTLSYVASLVTRSGESEVKPSRFLKDVGLLRGVEEE